MKKYILAILIVCLCIPLFAQQAQSQGQTSQQSSGERVAGPPQYPVIKESDYYATNVYIEKIYAYRKGYVVMYRSGLNGMKQCYLPEEWFIYKPEGAKAELIMLGSGTDWPHMTIYYKDGKFDHVTVLVRKERSHETWGMVPLNVDIDQNFENVQELSVVY